MLRVSALLGYYQRIQSSVMKSAQNLNSVNTSKTVTHVNLKQNIIDKNIPLLYYVVNNPNFLLPKIAFMK
jgi:hypothetical protein